LLKKMEAAGLVSRSRDPKDERNVIIAVTEQGMVLREQAATIPARMGACLHIEPNDAATLYALLHKLLGELRESPAHKEGLQDETE
jgi:DNA-binding MarR family transcriptional regulator